LSVSSAAKNPLLDRLLAERRISPQQRDAIAAYVDTNHCRVEDALIETGTLEESFLLKWLAALHKTRFVSTEKLAKAEIERSTLTMVPRSLAEKHGLFPVLFDPADRSLALVIVDPANLDGLRDAQLSANVKAVKGYVARPAAIRAAIHKHYGGDIHAFGKIHAPNNRELASMLDSYERIIDGDKLAGAPVVSTRASLPNARASLPFGDGPTTSSHTAPDFGLDTGLLAAPLKPAGARASITHNARARDVPAPQPVDRRVSSADTATSSSVEVVNVLVSLLENQRQELRGHSAQVSRLMQKVGEHMGLSEPDVHALRLCGLLHDVGKTSSYHLTGLNVAEYEGHRLQARKCFMSPVRLFEAASLPRLCVDGLAAVYERFDGLGFPDRRSGKDIPLAARLLAIAESYADLTANAKNPFRKTLSAKAAVEVLVRYKDKVFDGNLVDLFRVAALGEDMQSSLLNDRPSILLVDADAEETTVLELRLVEQGHEVVLCRTAEQAYKRFQQGDIDAVITEVDLTPHDGFTLVEYIRKSRAGADLPVFFLTRRADRASVDRGFQLGAVDYIIKPAAPDVVVAKARNVLSKAVRQRGARGVSGSMREMPLPDVLQVLSRTRKTGLLKVSSGGYVGEIQFGNGSIYNATYRHLRGENAVYSLLALADGEFALDPGFSPTSRAIQASTEQLLLEGMRRMDESAQPELPDIDFSATRVDDSEL
jgi:response regulator RpfG family c-di-GMP phosphodiesterase